MKSVSTFRLCEACTVVASTDMSSRRDPTCGPNKTHTRGAGPNEDTLSRSKSLRKLFEGYSKSMPVLKPSTALMQRSGLRSIVVAAAVTGMLASLAAPPLAVKVDVYTAVALPVSGFTAAIDGTVFCAAYAGDSLRDRSLRERWLESRTEEEESEFVAATEIVAASSLSLAQLAAGALRTDLTDSGRHLAWLPSAHAFSASVQPIRC